MNQRASGDHVGEEDLVALALGDVEGQRRATMAAHLLTCATCRHEYDAITRTIEDLLPAVPGVQPPSRFDERVLAALPRRRTSRRWWLAGVAAALVGVAAVGGWWLASSTEGADIEAVALARPDGATVGSVSLDDVDGERVMVVAIVDAPAGVSYTCRARLDDGTTVESHPWEPGAGAWLVPLPAGGDVTAVDLVVSGTDTVWSSADFT